MQVTMLLVKPVHCATLSVVPGWTYEEHYGLLLVPVLSGDVASFLAQL
jgi:hypothetical protein